MGEMPYVGRFSSMSGRPASLPRTVQERGDGKRRRFGIIQQLP
jgi:hypothetical protein